MVEPDEREFAKYFKPIESHDPRADIFECTLELTICDEDMTTPTMQYLCSNMEQLREALNKADDALCDNYTVLAVIDTSGTHRTIMHS